MADFKTWFDKDVRRMGDRYLKSNFVMLGEFCQTYDLHKKHFFKYLQLTYFFPNHRHLAFKTFKSFLKSKTQGSYFYDLNNLDVL